MRGGRGPRETDPARARSYVTDPRRDPNTGALIETTVLLFDLAGYSLFEHGARRVPRARAREREN